MSVGRWAGSRQPMLHYCMSVAAPAAERAQGRRPRRVETLLRQPRKPTRRPALALALHRHRSRFDARGCEASVSMGLGAMMAPARSSVDPPEDRPTHFTRDLARSTSMDATDNLHGEWQRLHAAVGFIMLLSSFCSHTSSIHLLTMPGLPLACPLLIEHQQTIPSIALPHKLLPQHKSNQRLMQLLHV